MLAELVDEATERVLSGQELDVDALIARHPDCAEALRGLLPAILSLAELTDRDRGASLPDADLDEEGRAQFGTFRILREVARGGMGIVFEAEQLTLGRRVALKILPRGLAMDPRALHRFQLEAHIAAGLQHPRIVPVHDVGLVQGVPYYAMRFIEGGSLAGLIDRLRFLVGGDLHSPDHASDEGLVAVATGMLSGRLDPPSSDLDSGHSGRPLPAKPDSRDSSGGHSLRHRTYLRAASRLVLQAADALDHAHDQGIIHRDIKPANLLIDLRGEVWVADFGMADVQGDAGMTASGDIPGTLRYMSPEQALGKRALVDRRTDIYALGATLYELLTLTPAVSGDDRREIFRKILEEEPTPLRRLNPAIPPDLATIVAKAMAKEPSNRYETARDLAEDLGRFLDGLPIVARPIGPVGRSWRWCRRRPVQATLVAALGLSLLVGLAGITWGWREAVRQKRLLLVAEREAREQAARASAVNRFLIEGLLERAEPAGNPAAERLTLSEALERASERVGPWFVDQPELEATIRLAIGGAFHGLGEYLKSEAHYRAALEGFERAGSGDRAGRLQAESELAHQLSHLGRWEESRGILSRVAPEARQVLGRSHATTLRAALYLAESYRATGELVEAEQRYRACLEDAQAAPDTAPDLIFAARFHLGDVFLRQGRDADAEALYRELLDDRRPVQGPNHPHALTTLNNLGVAVERLGRIEEAERIFRDCLESGRQVFGDRHPETATAMLNLGHVLSQLDRLEDAEPLIRAGMEVRQETLGPEHPETQVAIASLAQLVGALGRQDEADALLGRLNNPAGSEDGSGRLERLLEEGWLRPDAIAAPPDSFGGL